MPPALPALPVFARREAGRVVFRDGPMPLSFQFDNLRASDGHAVSVFVRAGVRAVDRPADVQLFVEQFLVGREAVAADDLRGHFLGLLATAAGEFVATGPAAEIVDRPGGLDAVLRKRAEAAAFGCGLEVVHPWSVSAESPTLRGERDREQARKRQLADADHAAALAERLAAAGPAARLPASDQAALLPALLAACPPAAVLLSAGPNVVVLDPDDTLRTFAAPQQAGPLRCVRVLDADTIALGGTGGVALLDGGYKLTRFLPGGGNSGRGFNSVARLPNATKIVATHGELGLCVWDASDTPAAVFPAPAARGAIAAGDVVWFAAGSVVCLFDGDAVSEIAKGLAAIVTVLAIDGTVVVVRQDGMVETFDAGTRRPAGGFRHSTAVLTATTLDAGGLRAVLIGNDRGDIDAVTLDGQPLRAVAVRTGGGRMLAVAAGRVVAVSADRASVVLRPIAGDESPVTLNILARTGYHLTDVTARVL